MSSYKEKRNFKVTMRLSFSHFREVLLYAVKTLLKFEMNKVISAVSSGLETISQKNNNKKTNLSQLFLGLWQYVFDSTYTVLFKGRNKL